ncbi:MAG TPA: hypothetical protein VGQ73_07995 [Gemmatimonadales bacterium]|jgi:photosystem II stability/assembly factor-like uncharacterized protein|nr:hypothetical protein [Gemmatimonadales bacterium]
MRCVPLFLVLLLTVRALAAQAWTAEASGTSAEFRGLHAVSAKVAWAAGRGGIVAHTEDGGKWWRADSIPGAANLFLIAVHALDARRVWVAGTAFAGASLGRIYHSQDGGKSWQLQYENAARGVFLDGMAFWDRRHGIAFGDPLDGKLLVITTDDGGAHWTPVPAERLPVMLAGEAAFAASGTAIAVAGSSEVWIGTGGGAKARVLHSADRGRSWEVRETPASGNATKGIFGIARGRGGYAVAVGGDYRQRDASNENLLRSEDGGQSWKLAASPGLKGVQYGVVHGEGARFVAVGPGGSAATKDNGRCWFRLEGPGFNTVSCVRRICWAGGVDGRIDKIVIK